MYNPMNENTHVLYVHLLRNADGDYGRHTSGILSMIADGSIIAIEVHAGGAFFILRNVRLGIDYTFDCQEGRVTGERVLA